MDQQHKLIITKISLLIKVVLTMHKHLFVAALTLIASTMAVLNSNSKFLFILKMDFVKISINEKIGKD